MGVASGISAGACRRSASRDSGGVAATGAAACASGAPGRGLAWTPAAAGGAGDDVRAETQAARMAALEMPSFMPSPPGYPKVASGSDAARSSGEAHSLRLRADGPRNGTTARPKIQDLRVVLDSGSISRIAKKMRPHVVGLCTAALMAAGCRPAASEKRERGAEIYSSLCGRCHGSDGRGGLASDAGRPAPRNFADPAFQRSRTDEQIRAAIVDGAGAGAMPSFSTTLSSEQLDALTEQVRSFGPEERGR